MIRFMKTAMVKFLAVVIMLTVILSSFSTVAFASGYRGLVVASVLNVRSAPSTDSQIVGQYPYGTVIDLFGIEDGFYKITYNNAEAYVSCSYVKFMDAAEASRYATERSKAQRLLDIAGTYIGTPYAYGGMSPVGFDCSGFVKYCFSQLGYDLNRTAASQLEHGRYVSKEELLPGDLVFFIIDGYSISHVGIYVGDGMMIHSPKPGRRVEYVSINDAYYGPRYNTARRIFE